MVDLKKYWTKLNAYCAGWIKFFQRLIHRSKRMRHANGTSEQIETIEDQALWQNIMTRLPDEYDIPNLETVHSLLPMTADYYRDLFTNPSPNQHLLVDEQIWMKIKVALPQNYKIPEQDSLK